MTDAPANRLTESALRTIHLEQAAIADLAGRIDDSFVHACRLILACPGRVVVVGMGKSGHIGRKIAATLASTGTPLSLYTLPKPATAIWA